MTRKKHVVVWDTIAFAGGSKNATVSLLDTLDSTQIHVTVITRDPASWQGRPFTIVPLREVGQLADKTQGVGYFLRHVLLVMNLCIARCQVGKIDMVVGASGPGNDVSLYMGQWLFSFCVVQLVHGPVACSRTIGRCLMTADTVCYLPSTKASIQHAIHRLKGASPDIAHCGRFVAFKNGLSVKHWPSLCQQQYPQLFWAASLLKWKGLDLFIQALQQIDTKVRPPTHICYIRPTQITLPLSLAPVSLARVTWHEQPVHFDQLRAECNIFISTSDKEPFGLSLLEAMAAGHCIVLPKDGAYWDGVLIDGENCIKYQPGNAEDLAAKIRQLQASSPLRKRLGRAAYGVAKHYVADDLYRPLTARIHRHLGVAESRPRIAPSVPES